MIKCPECGKWFKSLGYARHRTMHYEKRRAANQGDSKNNPQQTKERHYCKNGCGAEVPFKGALCGIMHCLESI